MGNLIRVAQIYVILLYLLPYLLFYQLPNLLLLYPIYFLIAIVHLFACTVNGWRSISVYYIYIYVHLYYIYLYVTNTS